MSLNIFLGDSIKFAYQSRTQLKNGDAFFRNHPQFNHLRPFNPASITCLDDIDGLFQERLQTQANSCKAIKSIFTHTVIDLVQDLIAAENIEPPKVKVRLQGPNTLFLEASIVEAKLYIVTDYTSRELTETRLSKQIRNIEFETSLMSWENDPAVTGNKAKAARLIREAFQKMEGPLTTDLTLDLSGMSLSSLPSAIGYLTSLANLGLSRNQLTDLPPSFEKLSQLKRLNLFKNLFTEVPPLLSQLNRLHHLNLSYNHLQFTTNHPCFPPNLRELYLTYCDLKALPEALFHLNRIEKLIFTGNPLTCLPRELFSLRTLTTLDFDQCELEIIPEEIGLLTELEYLHLDENMLDTLPSSIGSLKRLIELYLWENSLVYLPNALAECTSLMLIDAAGNEELCYFPVTLAFLPHFSSFLVDETEIDSNTVAYILSIQPPASLIGQSDVGFELCEDEEPSLQKLRRDEGRLRKLIKSYFLNCMASVPETQEDARLQALIQIQQLRARGFKERSEVSDHKDDDCNEHDQPLLPANFFEDYVSDSIQLFDQTPQIADQLQKRANLVKVKGNFATYCIKTVGGHDAFMNTGIFIAQGGSRTVTLGLNLNEQTLVAIAKTRLDSKANIECVQTEIKIAGLIGAHARLLLPTHTQAWEDEHGVRKQYSFMPYCEFGIFSNAGRLPLANQVLVALDAIQGLQALHNLGVAHRDITPANILLGLENGITRAKLADFGIAAVVNESNELNLDGTHRYMSPARLWCLTAKTPFPAQSAFPEDVWGLGLVFYELFIDPTTYSNLFKAMQPNYIGLSNHYIGRFANDTRTLRSPIEQLIHSMMYPQEDKRATLSVAEQAMLQISQNLPSENSHKKKRKTVNDTSPRTTLMKKRLLASDKYDNSTELLEIGGKKHQVVTAGFHHFADHTHPLVSCGAVGRELITLDPAQSSLLQSYRDRFKQQAQIYLKLHEQTKFTAHELSIFIVQFITMVLPQTDFESVIATYTGEASTLKIDSDPCIPLDAFLAAGKGVCRHHAFLTAYLLDAFIKQNPTLCNFSGVLQLMRDRTKDGDGHAWVTLISNTGQKISIDTLHHLVGDLNSPHFVQTLIELWGEAAVSNQISKANGVLPDDE